MAICVLDYQLLFIFAQSCVWVWDELSVSVCILLAMEFRYCLNVVHFCVRFEFGLNDGHTDLFLFLFLLYEFY